MTAFGEYVDDGTASAMKQRDYKDATDLITVAPSAHFESMRGWCDGGGKGYLGSDEVAFTLSTTHDQDVAIGIAQSLRVRRLTPLECERLQGFPDGYTDILGASDTARYKALGNSMAVNVMQLIGNRIQMVNQIQKIGIAA